MRRFLLAGFAAAVLVVAQQQPSVSNAQQKAASASAGLDGAIRSASNAEKGPLWIGYPVATIPGERNSCCWNNSSYGCGLEGNSVQAGTRTATGPVQLEGPTHVTVLLRVEGGEVGRVRTLSTECPLDAGGLPFYWLTGVRAADSVALLTRMATQHIEGNLRSKAGEPSVHAIAVHAGPEAAAALERFATSGSSESIRKTALFWLANARGRRGFEVVSKAAREDASDKVREHAVFALTQSQEAEAIPAIIRIAREDRSAHVRGQALFWLGQKAARQSAGTLSEAIEKDPDTEVKKKAVFALYQLPKDEGVPKLIDIARTHSNAAVKKQALFWLGQSKDPRALKFFEQLLSKP